MTTGQAETKGVCGLEEVDKKQGKSRMSVMDPGKSDGSVRAMIARKRKECGEVER